MTLFPFGKRPSVSSAEPTLDEIWCHLSKVQVRRRYTLTVLGILAVLVAPFVASFAAETSPWYQGVKWFGLILILAAFLGRSWCMLYLGGRKGSELIQQGPYSISRNPLYVFSVMAVVGIGAQTGSIVFGAVLALGVYAVFNYVISEEEVLLRKVFGSQFDGYCARVPRFWPRFSGWKSDPQITVDVSGLGRTVRDALPYFLAIPVFAFIAYAQISGWLPVLLRLP